LPRALLVPVSVKREIANELQALANKLRDTYSDPSRNWKARANNEPREIHKVIPISDETGAIVLRGTESGLQSIYFCYWLQFQNKGEWRWILPTYDKVYGMSQFASIIRQVEARNFNTNIGVPE